MNAKQEELIKSYEIHTHDIYTHRINGRDKASILHELLNGRSCSNCEYYLERIQTCNALCTTSTDSFERNSCFEWREIDSVNRQRLREVSPISQEDVELQKKEIYRICGDMLMKSVMSFFDEDDFEEY